MTKENVHNSRLALLLPIRCIAFTAIFIAGALITGKKVAVIAQGPEAVSEANFLSGLCSEVHWFGAPQEGVDPRIVLHGEKPEAILGGMKANALQADGQPFAVDGIFIFREAMALSAPLRRFPAKSTMLLGFPPGSKSSPGSIIRHTPVKPLSKSSRDME